MSKKIQQSLKNDNKNKEQINFKECGVDVNDDNYCHETEQRPLRNSSKKINAWKFNAKKDLFGTTKFSRTSEVYRLTVTAVFLALSVGFSLIEIGTLIPLKWPWGADFDFRLFDSLLLFFAIRMVGLVYSILIATLMPWIHVAIDGAHSPISMVGFMIGDIICVLLFWVIYYKIFKAGLEKKCFEDDVIENDSATGIHHKHQFKKNSLVKRIIALCIISILCSFVESLMQDMVFWIMISGLAAPKADEMNVATLKSFFYGINILWTTLFFAGICSVKYVAESALFFITEKRMAIISDRFGVW